MRDLKLHTPDGVQDYLFEERMNKREVENKIMRCFLSRGYREIESPMFEYYDVFSDGIGAVRQEKTLKFFDNHGRILVLRPDLTMPIARIASTKLAGEELPLRICYLGNAFGQESGGLEFQREFTQAGVELMGESGFAADAEVILLAVNTLKEIGLFGFKIDIGHIDFFKGLAEEAGLNDEETEELRGFVDAKDMLAVELMLKRSVADKSLRERILRLPTLYGEREVLESAKSFSHSARCENALERLCRVYDMLKELGLENYISIDLGFAPSLDYYTGILFKGLSPGLGQPLLSGGRYDGLCKKFGRDLPATGFAMGIKRLLIALENQGRLPGGGDASAVPSDAPAEPNVTPAVPVTIALSKGRLAELSIELMEKCGVDCSELKEKSRKLIFYDVKNNYRFILVKPADVPTYVDRGIADIGIVGKDTLLEENRPLYEMLDLGFSKCRLCIAGNREARERSITSANFSIATKYPNIARRYYGAKGQTIDIVRLGGSVELGTALNMTDAILDIVESGKTLEANGLEVLEEIYECSARLVVNRVSLKTKRGKINGLIAAMKHALEENQ